MKKAPWTDFKGNDIHEGDTIIHPDGDKGIVKHNLKYQSEEDNWLIDYDNYVGRLCLQIGDKGQGVVEKTPFKFLETSLPDFVKTCIDIKKIDTLIGTKIKGEWEDETTVLSHLPSEDC